MATYWTLKPYGCTYLQKWTAVIMTSFRLVLRIVFNSRRERENLCNSFYKPISFWNAFAIQKPEQVTNHQASMKWHWWFIKTHLFHPWRFEKCPNVDVQKIDRQSTWSIFGQTPSIDDWTSLATSVGTIDLNCDQSMSMPL